MAEKPAEEPRGALRIRGTETGNTIVGMIGTTMTKFAQGLARLAGRTVVDKTGIEGQFSFHLEYTRRGGRTLRPPLGQLSVWFSVFFD